MNPFLNIWVVIPVDSFLFSFLGRSTFVNWMRQRTGLTFNDVERLLQTWGRKVTKKAFGDSRLPSEGYWIYSVSIFLSPRFDMPRSSVRDFYNWVNSPYFSSMLMGLEIFSYPLFFIAALKYFMRHRSYYTSRIFLQTLSPTYACLIPVIKILPLQI